MIGVGEPAPDFTLRNQDGEKVSLSDFRGRKLLLVFYPLDFSPVCSDQLSIYQEVKPEIEAKGVTMVGISVDSGFAHKAFQEKLALDTPLLADFDPRARWRVLRRPTSSGRAPPPLAVLVDEEGRWSGYTSRQTLGRPRANLIFDVLLSRGSSRCLRRGSHPGRARPGTGRLGQPDACADSAEQRFKILGLKGKTLRLNLASPARFGSAMQLGAENPRHGFEESKVCCLPTKVVEAITHPRSRRIKLNLKLTAAGNKGCRGRQVKVWARIAFTPPRTSVTQTKRLTVKAKTGESKRRK